MAPHPPDGQTIPTAVTTNHRHYLEAAQRLAERRGERTLFEQGHPDAKQFGLVQAFFERLSWRANTESRYYAYDSDTERVELWKPSLHVTRVTTEVESLTGDEPIEVELTRRAGEDYFEALADTKLSPMNTYLSPATWIITTERESVITAVEAATDDRDGVSIQRSKVPRRYFPGATPPMGASYRVSDDDTFECKVYVESKADLDIIRTTIGEQFNQVFKPSGRTLTTLADALDVLGVDQPASSDD